MKQKGRDSNGDEGSEGIELQKSRGQRDSGGQQDAEKLNQIEKSCSRSPA